MVVDMSILVNFLFPKTIVHREGQRPKTRSGWHPIIIQLVKDGIMGVGWWIPTQRLLVQIYESPNMKYRDIKCHQAYLTMIIFPVEFEGIERDSEPLIPLTAISDTIEKLRTQLGVREKFSLNNLDEVCEELGMQCMNGMFTITPE